MGEKAGFWHKPLSEMSESEWEALCDGCGKCCLNKLIDDDTEEVYFTCVACKLLDHDSCRCSNYEQRFKHVPDCYKITADNVTELTWLPPSCAYRRLDEGRGLPSWHPLLQGNSEAMHKSKMSVKNRVMDEDEVGITTDVLLGCIVHWPSEDID